MNGIRIACSECGFEYNAPMGGEIPPCPRCERNRPENSSDSELGNTGAMGTTGNNSKGSIGEFFAFQIMLSGVLVKISYIIGMVLISLWGIVMTFSVIDFGIGAKRQFVEGVFILLLGNIMWRLICESAVVLFEIHKSLISIDKKMKNGDVVK